MTTEIFVFGSNLAGRHGAGAALHAVRYHGAIYGQGAGLQGKSYAIPTKDHNLDVLSLEKINQYVKRFIIYAAHEYLKESDKIFNVTAIGTGLAGYSISDIAPMFKKAADLPNVRLNEDFIDYLFAGKCRNEGCSRSPSTDRIYYLCRLCHNKLKNKGDLPLPNKVII